MICRYPELATSTTLNGTKSTWARIKILSSKPNCSLRRLWRQNRPMTKSKLRVPRPLHQTLRNLWLFLKTRSQRNQKVTTQEATLMTLQVLLRHLEDPLISSVLKNKPWTQLQHLKRLKRKKRPWMMASLKLKQDKRSNTTRKLRRNSGERLGSKGGTQIYTTKLHKGPTTKTLRTSNNRMLRNSKRRKHRSLRCRAPWFRVQILSCRCPKTSFLPQCPYRNNNKSLKMIKRLLKHPLLQRKTLRSYPWWKWWSVWSRTARSSLKRKRRSNNNGMAGYKLIKVNLCLARQIIILLAISSINNTVMKIITGTAMKTTMEMKMDSRDSSRHLCSILIWWEVVLKTALTPAC